MSHSSSSQSFSTEETTPLCSMSRSRRRALSLLSISSSISLRSVPEIAKGETTVIVSQKPEKHEAWGSFIPLRSATTSLREFTSVPPYTNPSSPRRRRTSYASKSSYSGDSQSSFPNVPYITRTLPTPIRPPSLISSSSSMTSHHADSDLHPTLAQLEKKSKFCKQKLYCSTCRKAGTDFPRCAKCGEMWCSRSCRLVGGKRHVCNSRT